MIINSPNFEKLCRRIDSWREEMIELQRGLTAIPAISPQSGGAGEMEKALYLQRILAGMGFTGTDRIDAPDERVSGNRRPNIILKVGGAAPKRATWVLTHLDIVPPGEVTLWSNDPYELQIREGRIYGRGVVDNQQDMVASIFAARAFMAEHITPPRPIGLAFVADEETGSGRGLAYLLTHLDNPFQREDLIIVPDAGSEDGSMIEIAEKSILWLRFITTGKQCHASRPAQGNNAFLAASHLVVKLNELNNLFSDRDDLFEPPESTFQATKKEANVPNINTIPGEDIFHLDCRVLPQYPLTTVKKKVREMADGIERDFSVKIKIEIISDVQAPVPTAFDAPVVVALKDAIRDVYRQEAKPYGIGGGTVAAYFRRHGYPAAVWTRNTCTAHQPDENCIIDDMVENAKVFAHVFLQDI